MTPERLRRTAMVTAVAAFEVTILALSPLLLAGSLLVAAVTRSSRPWRSTALVLAYARIELGALARLLRGGQDWDVVVADVLDQGYRAMRRILRVRLVLEEGSVAVDEVRRAPGGVVVLARHCGPGDSLFIAWLLAVHYRLALRIVLTARLRWEPAVDLAGDHLPLCFVGDEPDAAKRGVARLAAGMQPGDALLLFPEGGNFSWPRWRAAIRHLREHGEWRRAARAARQTHTLPPRVGGASAALAAAPDADVLLLTHSGFGVDGRDRPWWRVPVDHDLTVRTVLVPAAAVPRDDAGVQAFLDRAWASIDTWVEGHADLAALTDPRR